eukprot:gene31593-6787_t
MLSRCTGKLDEVRELLNESSTAGKMLEFIRSVPDLLGALVGHKTREYVESNTAVVIQPLLTALEFDSATKEIKAAIADA